MAMYHVNAIFFCIELVMLSLSEMYMLNKVTYVQSFLPGEPGFWNVGFQELVGFCMLVLPSTIWVSIC